MPNPKYQYAILGNSLDGIIGIGSCPSIIAHAPRTPVKVSFLIAYLDRSEGVCRGRNRR